jgi:hypothetical protein
VSILVICNGCGKKLEVGADYARKKMRCPECGVIFELPASSKKNAQPSEPTSRPIDRPAVKLPAKEPVGVQTAVKEAPPSGLKHEILPLSPSPKRGGERVSSPSLPEKGDRSAPRRDEPEIPATEDEGEEERCPVCNEPLPLEASTCSLCGYVLPVGKKAFKINQPLERHWEAGMPFRKRLRLFLACQGAVLVAMTAGALAGVNAVYFLFPWLVFTGMTAFLFGSYDRIDLTRNKKGKVRLKQTWRICFWSRAPIAHRLGDYEDLSTGVANDFSDTDQVILICLMISAVLPALSLVVGFSVAALVALIPGFIPPFIWWYCAFHKDNYFVVLCRDHGYPAVTLYRGWNEAHAQDMAKTICEVTGLPRRRI